jgi:hypothetical protein
MSDLSELRERSFRQKWEYCKVNQSNNGDCVMGDANAQTAIPTEAIGAVLNRFGDEGWELIQMYPGLSGVTYLFKRPKAG